MPAGWRASLIDDGSQFGNDPHGIDLSWATGLERGQEEAGFGMSTGDQGDATVPAGSGAAGGRLINISDLTGAGKIIERLLQSLETAMGYAFRPSIIRREGRARITVDAERVEAMARAEAAAKLIVTRTDIEVEQLRASPPDMLSVEQRAVRRLRAEKMRGIENVERIVDETVQLLQDKADIDDVEPQPIDPDWLDQFLRFAENVSDERIRQIWATILARQGTERDRRISIATLKILRLLEPRFARQFRQCVQFSAVFGKCFDVWDQNDDAIDLNLHDTDTQMLEEVGFLRRADIHAPTLVLRDCVLAFHDEAGQPKSVHYQIAYPSWRGTELASVFFPHYLDVANGSQGPDVDIAGPYFPIAVRQRILREWAVRFSNYCHDVRAGFSMPLMNDVTSEIEFVLTHRWTGNRWEQLGNVADLRRGLKTEGPDRENFNKRLNYLRRLLKDPT